MPCEDREQSNSFSNRRTSHATEGLRNLSGFSYTRGSSNIRVGSSQAITSNGPKSLAPTQGAEETGHLESQQLYVKDLSHKQSSDGNGTKTREKLSETRSSDRSSVVIAKQQRQQKKNKKKKQNQETELHPKPKRPMSAYNFFFREERARIIEEKKVPSLILVLRIGRTILVDPSALKSWEN